MYLRYALIGLLAVLFTASMAAADGHFTGAVLFPKLWTTDCEWESEMYVYVYNVLTPGNRDRYLVSCCYCPTPDYEHGMFTTADYPPGTYVFELILPASSDCYVTKPDPQFVHGMANQSISIKVEPRTQGQPD